MTGTDLFSEILRQATLLAADSPEQDRQVVMLQYVLGAAVGTAVNCYDHHAYAEAQDLITLCARMVDDANERIPRDASRGS